MKKIIVLALCLVLAGMLAVNGTFAADFTQTISEAVSSLFQTVQELANPNPTTAPADFNVSLVYPNESGTALPVLIPGGTVEHNVTVRNDSDALPAYFRIAFAVQADAFPLLTLQFNEDSSYAWLDGWRDITIGGRDYKLMVGTYQQALTANETSPSALLGVTLRSSTTSAQMTALDNDFLLMQALAINANDFVLESSGQMSATDALDKALPVDSANFNPFQ